MYTHINTHTYTHIYIYKVCGYMHICIIRVYVYIYIMCVYKYVYMHTNIYVCMYAYTPPSLSLYIYIYIYTHTHIYLSIYIYVCVCVCVCESMYVCIYIYIMCVYIYIHLYICVYLSMYASPYIYLYIYTGLLVSWVECSPKVRETWVQSQVPSYQRLLRLFLIPPCLTPINIRYVWRVKWSNLGKGVAPSPTPQCSSYWKGSLLVALDYGRELYYLYILKWIGPRIIYIFFNYSAITYISSFLLSSKCLKWFWLVSGWPDRPNGAVCSIKYCDILSAAVDSLFFFSSFLFPFPKVVSLCVCVCASFPQISLWYLTCLKVYWLFYSGSLCVCVCVFFFGGEVFFCLCID